MDIITFFIAQFYYLLFMSALFCMYIYIHLLGVLGENAFMWALRRKFYAMMKLLKDRGNDLSIFSKQGFQALHIAVKSGNLCINTHLFI